MPATELYIAYEAFLATTKDVKLLVTPPEIGKNGQQSNNISSLTLNATDDVHMLDVERQKTSGPFEPSQSWVINRDVSDEKLIKILQMLNAMSFDLETFTVVNYGGEGDALYKFIWTGEPYDSQVVYATEPKNNNNKYIHALSNGVKTMSTGIVVEGVARQSMERLFEPLKEYARSDAAKAMAPKLHREEIWKPNLSQKERIDFLYANGINDLVRFYLINVMRCELYLEETWDDYIDELKQLGLNYYIDFYNAP
jgi:hypothetical protein